MDGEKEAGSQDTNTSEGRTGASDQETSKVQEKGGKAEWGD